MRRKKSPFAFDRIAGLMFVALTLVGNSLATTISEKVIYKFQGFADGSLPNPGLVADAAGNLYGTTLFGGVGNQRYGTVFELSPPAVAGGAWTKTILYVFKGGGDGEEPGNGPLIFDKPGNLFGITSGNGTIHGGATIFELKAPTTPGGAWTKITLWNFNGSNGNLPNGKLAMDSSGNLYGTAEQGGSHNQGLVFELMPPTTAGARWKEKILYNFGGFAGDGFVARGGVLLRGGVLYGTTGGGGSANQGIVFQLVPKSGLWTETILHSFVGSEGSGPFAGLIADAAGNLYGTATFGGNTGCTNNQTATCGTLYELSPPAVAGDPWQETTLYIFSSDNGAGINPSGVLWRDKAGDLYGTTNFGGLNWGTVFKLKPPATAGGTGTLVVLHSFRGGTSGDGQNSSAGLILVNGAFYGTTGGGGTQHNGTVFSISFAP